jgi:acyl-CoA synthetase (AMP-forming)/AMP-acid ligase II
LDRAVAERLHADALIGSGTRYTYLELDAAVNAAAAGLQALSVKPGDRVAATLCNHPDLVVAFLATQRIGAIWLGINPGLAAPEKLYQLQDAGVRIYLADKNAVEQIAGFKAQMPALEHIVDIDPGQERSGWRRLLDDHHGAPRPSATIDPDAPAAISYTSGTTGRPKGAVHSQHNMVVVAATGHAGLRGSHWQQRLRVGVYLPLTTFNLMVLDVLPCLSGGGTCICMDRVDAAGVAEWIEREKVEAMSSAPATIFDLLNRPEISATQLASIKFISCGGAQVTDELRSSFARRFGRPMYPAYGMTEAPTAVAGYTPDRECASGSCGIPYAHLRIAILDPNDRELPPDETGEVCIRCTDRGHWAGVYTPMLGYWGRPAETAAVLRSGWLHTGDAGAMDIQGNIFIRARLKDMIIRGGANIYPAEIERVLKLDSRVRDAAVIGKPDDRLGEVVAAFIELVSEARWEASLEAELRERCSQELAKYKVPEHWFFVPALPRNSMNKISKLELKNTYLERGNTHRQ